MDNEIENESGGISFSYIFRMIFSQKWLALAIAAIITLTGTLALYFTGKGGESYSVSFVSQIPNSESSPQEFVFPDGKVYRYEAMVSYENLEKVKNSKSEFSEIDIDAMHGSGGISISRKLAETAEGSKEYEATYEISAKASYFKTSALARAFLSELTQFPNRYLADMHISYDRSLEASRSAIQYDRELSYLNEQVNFLNREYDKFIAAYSGNFVVKDGKTLNYYQQQLQTFFDSGDIVRLKNEAVAAHYVKQGDDGKVLEAAIAKYRAEHFEKVREKNKIEAALQSALDMLLNPAAEESAAAGGTATGGSSSSGGATINIDMTAVINYTAQIAQLEQDIADIQGFIDGAVVNADFDKSVGEVEAQVEAFTNDFAEIAATVYRTKTTVSYLNTSVIVFSGGRGLTSSALLCSAVGIAVALIVAYTVGWGRDKRNKIADGEKNAAPSGEAQSQPADGAKNEK